MRAVLVALLIATPFLLLPGIASGATEMVVLVAMMAAALTFIEYNSVYPSFVEFRDAPPINRMRFISLFSMVFILTLICKHIYEPTGMTRIIAGVGELAARAVDFPYSPVRLVTLMLPEGTAEPTVQAVRLTSAIAYVIALITICAYLFAVRVFGWPINNGAFNVWVNLPLFDPTGGGDVVQRLQRDGRINVIFGVLLPFMIPAVIKIAAELIDPVTMENPQTLIWMISAWAFLPASMLMRGIAMLRISELIEEKRRRAYANAEALQTA